MKSVVQGSPILSPFFHMPAITCLHSLTVSASHFSHMAEMLCKRWKHSQTKWYHPKWLDKVGKRKFFSNFVTCILPHVLNSCSQMFFAQNATLATALAVVLPRCVMGEHAQPTLRQNVKSRPASHVVCFSLWTRSVSTAVYHSAAMNRDEHAR